MTAVTPHWIDEELFKLIDEEAIRQRECINLIASENYVSPAVHQANASVLTNKYSEGYPGDRYYGGTDVIDKVERLCVKRALEAFNLDPDVWSVNVQALSGSPANFAIYTALIGPNGKIMGLNLADGGHLTHGYQTKTRKISATSMFFQSQAYFLNENNLMDYDLINEAYNEFKPDILIVGGSSYPRDFDWKVLREIADTNESYLMADISHFSGFVITGLMNNPFTYCDVIMTTTHKTLRGPRGALIFSRKQKMRKGIIDKLSEKIDFAIFPGLNGGPHNHTIAAVATALKEAKTDQYRKYLEQVKINAAFCANKLKKLGYTILTEGTDCHLVLIDLSNKGIGGLFAAKICDLVNITINKNAIPRDTNVFNPKGIRIGTSALTTRGLKEEEFNIVIDLLDKAINLGVKLYKESEGVGRARLDSFVKLASESYDVMSLKQRVIGFISDFGMHVTLP